MKKIDLDDVLVVFLTVATGLLALVSGLDLRFYGLVWGEMDWFVYAILCGAFSCMEFLLIITRIEASKFDFDGADGADVGVDRDFGG